MCNFKKGVPWLKSALTRLFSMIKIELAGNPLHFMSPGIRHNEYRPCVKMLDFKRTHANNGLTGRVCCPSLELNPAGLMLNSFCKTICVCGLIGMLWPSHAVSQTTTRPSPAPQKVPNNPPQLNSPTRYFPAGQALPRETQRETQREMQESGVQFQAPDPNAASQPESSTRYVPLGQILPRATQESGVQFQAPDPMLREEVPVRESGPNRNLNLEPVLDEFSRIELFGDDSELKKVILMNRNTGAQSQAPAVTSAPPRNPRNPAGRSTTPQKPVTRPTSTPQSLPTTKLSKEQLQTLIRGAYRSPLPEKLWDDSAYREFLAGQGITSREEMKDRNKAKNVRKTVRRLLWQIKNKS